MSTFVAQRITVARAQGLEAMAADMLEVRREQKHPADL